MRNKENDILETTLSIAENEYSEAYRFLLNAYEESPSSFGPQTFYFLACLAGGANMPELALAWLRKAIQENNWWYRPEVLEDEDCLPKAKQLYAVTKQADCNVTLTVQENTRHQFPAQLYHV